MIVCHRTADHVARYAPTRNGTTVQLMHCRRKPRSNVALPAPRSPESWSSPVASALLGVCGSVVWLPIRLRHKDAREHLMTCLETTQDYERPRGQRKGRGMILVRTDSEQ